MKKLIAVIVLSAAVAFSAFAQPKAVGGRFAADGVLGLEASYEHYVGSPNFIEVEAAFNWWGGFGGSATALYNFMVLQPNWTSRGEWGMYAGVGVSGGYVGNIYRHTKYFDSQLELDLEDVIIEYYGPGACSGGMVSLVPQFGLEYTFWFPLQFSVDIRPLVGMHFNKNCYHGGVHFYGNGLYGFIPSISVRYAF